MPKRAAPEVGRRDLHASSTVTRCPECGTDMVYPGPQSEAKVGDFGKKYSQDFSCKNGCRWTKVTTTGPLGYEEQLVNRKKGELTAEEAERLERKRRNDIYDAMAPVRNF